MSALRIGWGYDVHRFSAKGPLMIGGVSVPYDRGVLAHSDGDVLLHAIGDALLGAAALGDLGQHFSDKDARYRHISSSILLQNIMGLLKERRFMVNNVDTCVVAEEPRLGSYKEEMKQNIAHLLALPPDAVNIKATTHEKMGCLGRGEGLAAQAVVLISTH